jgi:hypothetical protein
MSPLLAHSVTRTYSFLETSLKIEGEWPEKHQVDLEDGVSTFAVRVHWEDIFHRDDGALKYVSAHWPVLQQQIDGESH